ncbi:NAD-dependent epimerase/dehydratase family protein [Rhodospirillales bacterium]|nr:NAD-dependent epimerase/dehydratase family protein [Rhodospirillales bacterium]
MVISKGPYLVTGATGFVGSAVVRQLLAIGADVRVLARPGNDRSNLTGLDVDICEGDLLNPNSLVDAVKGCEGLFHVAADYRLWTRDPGSMFRANVDGTRAILRAAINAGVKRAIYTSSVAVLGIDPTGQPSDEETPVSFDDMIGVYKQSKFRAEEAAMHEIIETGLDCVIVNPSTPIGPRDIKPTPTGRLVVEAAAGRMPAYVDTGLNVAHVDDVAIGHLLAYEHGVSRRRYILGGDDMSLREILETVAICASVKPPGICIPRAPIYPLAFCAEQWCKIMGKGEPFATVDGLKMSKKKMYFSSKRAETELGYQHRSGRDALNDAVEWFRAQGYLNRA